ncbi:MAG: hypothetical protein IJ593_00310 [Lachnospiraceae bacterium]|nr:hypothetical protein [Lachnospiraceae bacterium]
MQGFIYLGIIGVLGIIYLIIANASKKKVKLKGDEKNTAQSFLNVADIENDCLYTLNGLYIKFIEIEPICIDLLSENDKSRLIRNLRSELVNIQHDFDLFAISQPFNVDKLLRQFEEDLRKTNNTKQRTLLKNNERILRQFVESGNTTERKFYFKLVSDKDIESVNKITENFKSRLMAAGLKVNILNTKQIRKLINLFNNLGTYNFDDVNNDKNTTPILKGEDIYGETENENQ